MLPDPTILLRAHRFWCGRLAGPADYPSDKAEIWFERSDPTDDYIRDMFGPHLDAVAAADWPLDALSPVAQIGLVILLDQFPRNIFRADPRAYAYDGRALAIAAALIEGGVARFRLVERMFLYLPFEHSEALEDQDRSVALYAELLAEAPAEQVAIYQNFLDFAQKHRDLIQRFGRFPHRNADLGRQLTAQEATFLAESGRGY
jgi:uncharacterized protein (DUF924 family)